MEQKQGKVLPDAEVPEGFTVTLALEDAVPVVLFCLATISMGRAIQSPLFVLGASIAFAAGALKVAWKLVMALSHRNIPLLSCQMCYVMPLGFLLMMNYREAEAVTVSCFFERMENICRLSAYDSDAFSTGLYSPRSKGIFSAYLDCPIHTMVWAALMSLGAMYPQLAHLYMRCLSGILVFAPQIGHNCVVGSHLESTTTCPVWRISLFLTRPRTLCCILRP